MKKLVLTVLLLTMLPVLRTQTLPSKSDIISTMRLVNEHWMARNTSPGNNQWARAAYFTGHLDFYKIYPREQYLDYALLWANNNNWSLNGGTGTRNADNQICGQIYIDLYEMDDKQDPGRIVAIKTSIDNMVNSTKQDDWWWVDALYMAMPVFTRLGILYDDEAYFTKMYQIYLNTKVTRGLYNTNEHLWYRDESFDPPYYTPAGEDSYWSRGNGWVIAAHVRVLQQLPTNHPNRAEYIETFQQMAAALLLRQRADGFWNVSLDDPNDFGGPETSGTSFFTYSLAWGINNGLLDSLTYAPAVIKAWNGLTSIAVQPTGFLSFIQGVGTSPASSQPVTINSTADFGVGAFLLAGTEVIKMAQGDMPVPSNFYLSSVQANDAQTITVSFNRAVDFSTALTATNYSIDAEVQVLSASAGSDNMTVVLHTTPFAPGRYSLSVSGVLDSQLNPIETGEKTSFSYSNIVAVTASGWEWNTSNTPDKTIDYDFSTRWSQQGQGEWIQYDLGEVKEVYQVDLAYFNGASRRAFLKIQLSATGTDTLDVFEGSSSGTTTDLEAYPFTPVEARYVKVIGYGNSQSQWNSITETRVHFNEIETGVSSVVGESDIRIFPNPSSAEAITIRVNDNSPCQISIVDLSGRMLYTSLHTPIDHQILLVGLPLQQGVYLLQVDRYSTLLKIF